MTEGQTQPSEPEPTPEAIRAILQDAEIFMKAPSGSLLALLEDNDWALIIKAHALIEAAVTSMLAKALDVRLRDVFERLELSREDCGKLEFARALELLDKRERSFIRLLSQLRNKLAHNPEYLGFSLNTYVISSLDKQQRGKFYELLAMKTVGDTRARWLTLVEQRPQVGVVVVTIVVIMRCLMGTQFAELAKREAEMYANLGKSAGAALDVSESDSIPSGPNL